MKKIALVSTNLTKKSRSTQLTTLDKVHRDQPSKKQGSARILIFQDTPTKKRWKIRKQNLCRPLKACLIMRMEMKTAIQVRLSKSNAFHCSNKIGTRVYKACRLKTPLKIMANLSNKLLNKRASK